jgi:hypothetical protein
LGLGACDDGSFQSADFPDGEDVFHFLPFLFAQVQAKLTTFLPYLVDAGDSIAACAAQNEHFVSDLERRSVDAGSNAEEGRQRTRRNNDCSERPDQTRQNKAQSEPGDSAQSENEARPVEIGTRAHPGDRPEKQNSRHWPVACKEPLKGSRTRLHAAIVPAVPGPSKKPSESAGAAVGTRSSRAVLPNGARGMKDDGKERGVRIMKGVTTTLWAWTPCGENQKQVEDIDDPIAVHVR